MDISAKYRFGIWGIAILIVLNMGLMSVLWYEHFDRRPARPPGDGKPNPDGFFVRELGLNKEQAESLSALREQQMRESEPIKAQIHSLRRQMTEELFAVEPDPVRMKELSEAIGDKQAEFDRAVQEHFGRVKQLCGPEQQEILKRLVLEALDRARMPPPPPGPGPGNRRGQPDDRRPRPPEGQRPPPGDRRPPPPQGGP